VCSSDLRRRGEDLVLHNLPAGDWAAGERGIACHPNRVDEFRAGVAKAISYAKVLEVGQLNCLAGKLPDGVSAQQAHGVFVENLRFAAGELKKAGLRLLIEPINTFDIPGFFLNRTDQALAILKEVGADNLYIQYDIYHAQRMEGEVAATLRDRLPQIGHLQLADNPGRNEPGTGELNYAFLFKHIDAIGYTGWIGCEYKPKAATVDGLGWRKSLTA
jgi:hydroxypyruvate isomerase